MTDNRVVALEQDPGKKCGSDQHPKASGQGSQKLTEASTAASRVDQASETQ
jgi:hypothetical protein